MMAAEANVAWWLAVKAMAGAGSVASVPRPIAGHAVFEMRVGVDQLGPAHPVLCAEGSPLAWLSVEGCGTGAGFLHDDPAPEMAHFRARARLAGISRGRGTVDWLLGAGFAEIQQGVDAPGFAFGQPEPGEPAISGAGPEASTGLKGRYYVDPWARSYVSADLTAGVAAIGAAPAVLGQQGPLVPFAAVTVGLGF